MRDEYDGRGGSDAADIGCVKARSLPELLVQGVLPPFALPLCPRARQGDRRGAEHGGIDHQKQHTVTDERARYRPKSYGQLSRVLELDMVLVTIVADEHHGAGHTPCERPPEQRVQPRPLQIREPQLLLCHTALLKEELPRSDRGSYDGDDQEQQAACNFSRRKTWNDGFGQ